MRKVGVFICHCGINIAGSVDVDKVAEDLKSYPGVAFATTYKYTCSDPASKSSRMPSRSTGWMAWSWRLARRRCTKRRSAARQPPPE